MFATLIPPDSDILDSVFSLLSRSHGKNWMIVVTTWKDASKVSITCDEIKENTASIVDWGRTDKNISDFSDFRFCLISFFLSLSLFLSIYISISLSLSLSLSLCLSLFSLSIFLSHFPSFSVFFLLNDVNLVGDFYQIRSTDLE